MRRLSDWHLRLRLYSELNCEVESELQTARREHCDAEVEAREARDQYQASLDWERCSLRTFKSYQTECQLSRERRMNEIQAVLEEARGVAGGMEWTP